MENSKEIALAQLRATLKEGDTLYTINRHVARSGMSRIISVVRVDVDGGIESIDWLIARAGIFKRSNSIKHDGLTVGGTGMDMGFHVVYTVSSIVLGDGYAIKQRWL